MLVNMKRAIKIGVVLFVASASWLIAQDAEKKVDEAEKAVEGKVELPATPATSERAAEKPVEIKPATADNQVGNIYNDGETTYATSQHARVMSRVSPRSSKSTSMQRRLL
jgi:hypothetical protein